MGAEEIKKLKDIIDKSRSMVFLGGAGVSTESGIPDFRSAKGLYNRRLKQKFSPEEMVSHTFLVDHPREFFEYYKKNLIYLDAKPNNAHKALAKLEEMGKMKAVVTQNIDGLHQMAGSKKVIELHGSVHRNFCVKCHATYDAEFVVNSEGIPTCPKCGGMVRPDVVLYEEALNRQDLIDAEAAISKADTMIVGGTSLMVYPAASLVRFFRGMNLIVINKTPTPADEWCDLVIHDAVGKVFKACVP
ncbi:NAD-dependent protein deacylase [Anaerovibrio sp. RM50]|uniref:NAD-dependent protein deacylase n=1 Tax=Anaerovibrio sp. RM50 TaxID=1200557 RepID=UPI00055A60C5|nr:NAD-dependent protein deacylase [Anaerovibrio sp. RM50]